MKNFFYLSLLLFLIQSAFSQVSVIKSSLYCYQYIGNVNNKLLFFATNALDYNYELWVSDGTEAGTQQLKDINPGLEGSILDPSYWGPQYSDKMPTIYQNELYFLAYEPTHGMEIWKSDGTASGTKMLKDIHPGTDGFFYPYFYYPYFTEMDGELFFAANDGTHGWELWKTDGTESGTEMVIDISSDGIYGSNPEHLINFNGTLIFTARDDVYGYEVYKSDGTAAGTEIIKDLVPGISGSMNDGYAGSIDPLFTVSGDYLYFLGRIDETFPVTLHLFRTDGTSSGTINLEDDLQYITDLKDVNGTCFFYAFDGNYEHSGLWKTDGSIAGTSLINTDDIFAYNHFFNFNNTLYFSGGNATFSEVGLYKSDGTSSGTSIVKNFEGLGSFPEVGNYILNEDGNSFFYRALFKITELSMDWRYVQTNGTTAGTKIFSGASPFRAGAFLDGLFYFPGYDTTGSQQNLFSLNPEIFPPVFINGHDENFQLTVYPNPANKIVTVQYSDLLNLRTQIEIIDISGKKLIEKIIPENASSFSIDISSFSCGLYQLIMKNEEKTLTTKFIIGK